MIRVLCVVLLFLSTVAQADVYKLESVIIMHPDGHFQTSRAGDFQVFGLAEIKPETIEASINICVESGCAVAHDTIRGYWVDNSQEIIRWVNPAGEIGEAMIIGSYPVMRVMQVRNGTSEIQNWTRVLVPQQDPTFPKSTRVYNSVIEALNRLNNDD